MFKCIVGEGGRTIYCCVVVARDGATERKLWSKRSVLTRKAKRTMLTQKFKSYCYLLLAWPC